ncbi:MAG: hypothetical protein FD119_120 [Stygiobacter sp.]|nr:MAG: hypothetical protein FD119_120 [Stygiobacter sp.]
MHSIVISDVTDELLKALENAGVATEELAKLRSGEPAVITVGVDPGLAPAINQAVKKAASKRHRGRPSVDDHLVAKANELIAGGMPVRAAARKVGISGTTLRRKVPPVGEHRGRERALSPEMAVLAREMRQRSRDEKGKWTLQRIADELEVSVSTVRRVVGEV